MSGHRMTAVLRLLGLSLTILAILALPYQAEHRALHFRGPQQSQREIEARVVTEARVAPKRASDLVEPVALDPTIKLDIRYATTNNFVGRAVYTEARAFLQRPAAEALVRVHQALKQHGYGLVIFDGYRPWAVTKIFWEVVPPERRSFVADPAVGSKHNRGCAVDLSLYDLKTGIEVEMPSVYDEMTERSHPEYSGGTSGQRTRRDLLRKAMECEGFTIYPNEWWHFDYKEWARYPILNIPFSEISRRGN
jgi:D-alanyl-D-alanine dipeptidase